MLIHILICDIAGVFWTPPPNSARQNSRPYYLYTPHPGAPLFHATVLFHSVAGRQVPPKRSFFLFFSFSSAPETTILLLTRRSATLPMGARGGSLCHRRAAAAVFCTSYLYKNRLYIMIYREERDYMWNQTFSTAYRPEWNDPVCCRRFDYEIGSRIRLLRSNRRIFRVTPRKNTPWKGLGNKMETWGVFYMNQGIKLYKKYTFGRI